MLLSWVIFELRVFKDKELPVQKAGERPCRLGEQQMQRLEERVLGGKTEKGG